MHKALTRRDFMKGTAYSVLGTALGLSGSEKTKARVVLVRSKDVWLDDARINPAVIGDMLDEAVMMLFDRKDPVAAFQNMVKQNDVVGIKSNEWAYMPTPAELEQTMARRLVEAGVTADNIAVDYRGVLGNPLFRKASALINVRPLRTHYWSGIGGCIKNYIMFTPNPPDYHPDSCADLARLWSLPAVKGKTRLNVLSALTPLFHGRGPHHFDRRYVWKYNGIIVGSDPVAVDTVGLHLITAKRRAHFGNHRDLPTPPKHIMMADLRHGLGTSDINKIELVKLGWKADCLI